MYQIHVFRFNPRSRCNSSSRCCYRARENVDPAWWVKRHKTMYHVFKYMYILQYMYTMVLYTLAGNTRHFWALISMLYDRTGIVFPAYEWCGLLGGSINQNRIWGVNTQKKQTWFLGPSWPLITYKKCPPVIDWNPDQVVPVSWVRTTTFRSYT